MSLKERIYSVLIVSSSPKFHSSVTSLLTESNCDPVQAVSSISAARKLWSERSFDYIIINSPLSDSTGTKFAIDVCSSKNTVVLMLLNSEFYDEIRDEVSSYGVFTLLKPTSRPIFTMALEWMSSAREMLRSMEKKAVSVEEKIKEIRLINKAKWILISEKDMTEHQAHRFIEKEAMDKCVSKKVIAESIIQKTD